MAHPDAADTPSLLEPKHRPIQLPRRRADRRRNHGHRLARHSTHGLLQSFAECPDLVGHAARASPRALHAARGRSSWRFVVFFMRDEFARSDLLHVGSPTGSAIDYVVDGE